MVGGLLRISCGRQCFKCVTLIWWWWSTDRWWCNYYYYHYSAYRMLWHYHEMIKYCDIRLPSHFNQYPTVSQYPRSTVTRGLSKRQLHCAGAASSSMGEGCVMTDKTLITRSATYWALAGCPNTIWPNAFPGTILADNPLLISPPNNPACVLPLFRSVCCWHSKSKVRQVEWREEEKMRFGFMYWAFKLIVFFLAKLWVAKQLFSL